MKYLILSALYLCTPEEMFLQRLVVVLLVFLLQTLLAGPDVWVNLPFLNTFLFVPTLQVVPALVRACNAGRIQTNEAPQ